MRFQALHNLKANVGPQLSMATAQGGTKLMRSKAIKQLPYVFLGILLFLFSLDLMGAGFKALGTDMAKDILSVTANPFIGLFIGLGITAVIQSSSTSTSMIVAMVASGSLDFYSAVPMIMGANIGTTLTSTIVSFGFFNNKNEFRKAIAAGVVHDFFNILTTVVLFPLEYYYQFLSSLAITITNAAGLEWGATTSGGNGFSLYLFAPLNDFLLANMPGKAGTVLLIVISVALLLVSIKLLSRSISYWFISRRKERVQNLMFGSTFRSFAWGTLITAGIQSSSISTSLIVPFVATGKVFLKKAFPFVAGANLGTTLTAILAALFKSEAAFTIAIAHLLFNLIGCALFLPVPFMRRLPVKLALAFGKLNMSYWPASFAYILLTFFGLPFMLILLNRHSDTSAHAYSHVPPKPAVHQPQPYQYPHWFEPAGQNAKPAAGTYGPFMPLTKQQGKAKTNA